SQACIHDSGILCDQFRAIGYHVVSAPAPEDHGASRSVLFYLGFRPLKLFIWMQLKQQLPARSRFYGLPNKGRPIFLTVSFSQIAGGNHHIIAKWKIIVEVLIAIVVIRHSRYDYSIPFSPQFIKVVLIPI